MPRHATLRHATLRQETVRRPRLAPPRASRPLFLSPLSVSLGSLDADVDSNADVAAAVTTDRPCSVAPLSSMPRVHQRACSRAFTRRRAAELPPFSPDASCALAPSRCSLPNNRGDRYREYAAKERACLTSLLRPMNFHADTGIPAVTMLHARYARLKYGKRRQRDARGQTGKTPFVPWISRKSQNPERGI